MATFVKVPLTYSASRKVYMPGASTIVVFEASEAVASRNWIAMMPQTADLTVFSVRKRGPTIARQSQPDVQFLSSRSRHRGSSHRRSGGTPHARRGRRHRRPHVPQRRRADRAEFE